MSVEPLDDLANCVILLICLCRGRRGGAGAAGGGRGRGGDGLGLQPVRRVGAPGVVGARAVVAALARRRRGGRAAAAARRAAAQGAQRRGAGPLRARPHVHAVLAPRAARRAQRRGALVPRATTEPNLPPVSSGPPAREDLES